MSIDDIRLRPADISGTSTASSGPNDLHKG